MNTSAFSWFDRANKVHRRDVPFVLELNNVISKLNNGYSDDISVMSGQAGMVPYYMTTVNFGEVEFLDRRGLTTDHFTSCAVTRNRPSDRFGRSVLYGFYFNNASDIAQKCGIKRPELIFELTGRGRANLVEERGYRVIFVFAGQFLSVRDDLLPHLGIEN